MMALWMPNKQAQGLFLALATAIYRTTTQCKTLNINECGYIASTKYGDLPTEWSFLWNVRKQSNQYFIQLADGSRWQIEELNN